jgi:hypothetical protein
MEQKYRVLLHEACVVPYRVTDIGVEFCLVTPISENRWEFPKVTVDAENSRPLQQLEHAAVSTGLRGQLTSQEPLGQYASARGNEARTMVGFLMQVAEVDESWPLENSYRRRWCLAEEARARIRRKPLRGFIEASLRCVDSSRQRLQIPAQANGHSAGAKRG